MVHGMRKRFPNQQRPVTINDVAALAGVSKGTVSKYLGGGNYYIAEDTKKRIAQAAAELDFRPNAIARGLVNRRSQTIGVIVASITNPVYPELIAGVDEVLGESDFTLIFGSSEGSPVKEANVVRSMRQRQVDGIIMASVTMRDAEVDQLVDSGLDVVLATRNVSSGIVDTVMVDNTDGAEQAVRHLVAHNHRRIAHIAGPQDVAPFCMRLDAYHRVCEAAGLNLGDDLLVVAEASTQEAGAAALERLLALPEPPTAVFIATDGMAIGVLEACARLGISVPQDLAIVGFDNVWVGRMPGVQLTTVDSRAREVGRLAAGQLLRRIEYRWSADAVARPKPELQVLPTELIRRRTCGCDVNRSGVDAS